MKNSPNISAAFCVVISILVFYTVAYAENETNALVKPVQDGSWSVLTQGSFSHTFNTDLKDGGGSFKVNSLFLQGGPIYSVAENKRVGVTFGYGYDDYNFSGTAGFAGLNPWSGIHSIRLSVPVRWALNENTELFVVPSLRAAGENGADLGDAITGGAFVGASFELSDTLTVGPGVGVVTQIEDDPSIFPILIIDWQFVDNFSLSTGPTLGATLGPGLTLNYQPTDKVTFALGGRMEKFRFRLDNNGTAPNGVGEDSGFSFFGGIIYKPNHTMDLALIAGARLAGEMRLEDDGGNAIAVEDYKTAPFASFAFRWLY